eukprot:1958302-Amphidinium_carterae.1
MNRVRALGLPATSKARIVKALYSVGLYGAEVGGMSASHMKDVRERPLVKEPTCAAPVPLNSWRMEGLLEIRK